jgi:hypothetical protein
LVDTAVAGAAAAAAAVGLVMAQAAAGLMQRNTRAVSENTLGSCCTWRTMSVNVNWFTLNQQPASKHHLGG